MVDRLTAVIFDLDGTLVDSAEGVAEAINYAFERTGLPTQPVEVLSRFIGYPLSHTFANFTDHSPDELYHHFQVRATETVVQSTTALPFADEVISQLHSKGLQLAIASTKRRNHIDGIVDKLGWESRFTALCGGDEIKQVKPAPDAFLTATKRLGVDADNVIVVGDTINDVLAAQAAGIRVAAVHSPYGGKDELIESDPDWIFDSLDQVVPLVARLQNGRHG